MSDLQDSLPAASHLITDSQTSTARVGIIIPPSLQSEYLHEKALWLANENNIAYFPPEEALNYPERACIVVAIDPAQLKDLNLCESVALIGTPKPHYDSLDVLTYDSKIYSDVTVWALTGRSYWPSDLNRKKAIQFETLPVREIAISDFISSESRGPLAFYGNYASSPTLAHARWPSHLFTITRGETVASLMSGGDTLSLLGPARYLIIGPSFYLAPGSWTIEIELLVDRHAARYNFRLEWGTSNDCVSLDFSPTKAGQYTISLTYEWLFPAQAEFRLVLTEGALIGSVHFGGADIRLELDCNESCLDSKPIFKDTSKIKAERLT